MTNRGRIIAIIKKVVRPESLNFGKEVRVVTGLLKKYSLEELEHVAENINFQVATMLFFYSKKGQSVINNCKNIKNSSKNTVGESKAGEDKNIKRKLSVKDFLNKYEEEKS